MEIKDKHERAIYDILKVYVKKEKNMYYVPFQQLLDLRKNTNKKLISQAPFINSVGETKWTDFSVLDKDKLVDLRIEIRSLDPKTGLKNTPYEYIVELKNMPEKEKILVLLGKGFDNQLIGAIEELIKLQSTPVTIVQSINEFKTLIKSKFN